MDNQGEGGKDLAGVTTGSPRSAQDPGLWRARMRTTLVIEAESNLGFEDALKHAVAVAREHMIQVSFSLPKSHGCPRVQCRTAKVRKVSGGMK